MHWARQVLKGMVLHCPPAVLACSWRMAFCAGVSILLQCAIHWLDATATSSIFVINLDTER